MYQPSLVYFIQEGLDGPIKIGSTGKCAHRRLRQMQVGNSRELRLIGLADLKRAADLERQLHRKLQNSNIRGEWFLPTRAVLDQVAKFPVGGELASS